MLRFLRFAWLRRGGCGSGGDAHPFAEFGRLAGVDGRGQRVGEGLYPAGALIGRHDARPKVLQEGCALLAGVHGLPFRLPLGFVPFAVARPAIGFRHGPAVARFAYHVIVLVHLATLRYVHLHAVLSGAPAGGIGGAVGGAGEGAWHDEAVARDLHQAVEVGIVGS